MTKSPLNAEQLLNGVAALHTRDIDLGLDRLQTLLSRLGTPQDNLPPVIHLAGTNGKGSTLTFLKSALEECGYSVHAFTSPHLVRPHECITLAGQEIGETDFQQLLQDVLDANNGDPLTVFEALTAAAFLGFSRTKGHVVLLETGLGGETDATNLVTQPALTILTPIALDHQEFLGPTIADIASVKAGILKQDVPCIVAQQTDEALQVIQERAQKLNVTLYREKNEWNVRKVADRLVFEGWLADTAWPLPGLPGDHQIQNAGVALAALSYLQDHFRLEPEAVGNGIAHAYWPGRLERIPRAGLLPQDWELWLDGGHNAQAASVLAQTLKNWTDKPLHIICGMLSTKDSAAFIEQLGPFADQFYTVTIPNHKQSRSAEALADIAGQCDVSATPQASIEAALTELGQTGKGPARVLICGSLYLLGAFLAQREEQ